MNCKEICNTTTLSQPIHKVKILRAYNIFMIKYVHWFFVSNESIIFWFNSWRKSSEDIIPQWLITFLHCTSAQ